MYPIFKSNDYMDFSSIFRHLYCVRSSDISKLLMHLHLMLPQAGVKSDYQMSLQIWKIKGASCKKVK